MPIYDAEDIVELKNREKRKKRRIKFLVFLFLVIIASGLYFTRELWVPKMRGIGKQYKTIVNSGRLADGNFPVEINAESDYQLESTGQKFIVLSDTSVYYYNVEGALMRKRQHGYSNAILRAGNGKALIYENGGNDLCVEDEEGIFYKKHFDNIIMFARISSEGYTAVVTTSDNYECELYVYNKKGTCIYERKCMERVNDLCFINSSEGCVISFIKAENGSLTTSVQQINFSQSQEVWTSPGLDTLGLEVYGYSEGAFVRGIDACGYVDKNGNISSFYRYDGDMVGGSSKGGKSAVIVNNDDRRKYIMALFDGGGKEPLIVVLDEPSVDVTVYGGLAYVMCQEEVRAYDFDGGLRSTATISDSYTGFTRSEDYIFLKSFSKIDRIDYES